MIAILDYGAGNQTSVRRALDFLGVPCVITADHKTIAESSGIIFPGVGAAGQAMDHLDASGMGAVLKEQIAQNKPVLGICLGCQIMLEHSEENNRTTLGIIKGRTRRFDSALTEEDGTPISIPHMGWNSLTLHQNCPLFTGISPTAEFYFVHSYYVEPEENSIIATTHYGKEFCSVFGRDGLWAVQFHVEKSGKAGLAILHNFYEYCQGVGSKNA